MIGARAKISGPGRRPKLKVHPFVNLFPDPQDQIAYLVEIFKMSFDQAREHIKLSKGGLIYVTEWARCECDYQIIVTKGHRVPRQGLMGAPVARVAIRRIDGKPGPFDWDDMQDIKASLFGNEVEAMEIFPKKSRAMIGGNEFRYLWVLPEGDEIPVGPGST